MIKLIDRTPILKDEGLVQLGSVSEFELYLDK